MQVVSTVSAGFASLQNAISPYVPNFAKNTVSFLWNKAIAPIWNNAIAPLPVYVISFGTNKLGTATPKAAAISFLAYAALGLAYFKGRDAATFVGDNTGLTKLYNDFVNKAAEDAAKKIPEETSKVNTAADALEKAIGANKAAITAAQKAAADLNGARQDAYDVESLKQAAASAVKPAQEAEAALTKLADDADKASKALLALVEKNQKAPEAYKAKQAVSRIVSLVGQAGDLAKTAKEAAKAAAEAAPQV